VINILEETLKNANKAFGLQLWVSRTLFVVGLGLLATAVSNAVISSGVNQLNVTLGAGSLLSIFASAVLTTEKKIGSHLVNITQVETVVMSYTREVSLLEEFVYQVLDSARTDPATAKATVAATLEELKNLSEQTTTLLQSGLVEQNSSSRDGSKEKAHPTDREGNRTSEQPLIPG
jgi:hypothetical protein